MSQFIKNTNIFDSLAMNYQNLSGNLEAGQIINININKNSIYLNLNEDDIFHQFYKLEDFLNSNISPNKKTNIIIKLSAKIYLEIFSSNNYVKIYIKNYAKILNFKIYKKEPIILNKIENTETLKLNLLTFIKYILITNYIEKNLSAPIRIKRLIELSQLCLSSIYHQKPDLNILDIEINSLNQHFIQKIIYSYYLITTKCESNQQITINGYLESKNYILEFLIGKTKLCESIRF